MARVLALRNPGKFDSSEVRGYRAISLLNHQGRILKKCNQLYTKEIFWKNMEILRRFKPVLDEAAMHEAPFGG